jgi:intracellular septation protein A
MGSEIQDTPKRENGFHSLLFNILIPVIILTQGDRLIASPASVLVIALAFPVAYFIWDYQRRKKANFISILGFVSVLLTGGVGILQLPRFWFIVKETAIPAVIGLAVVGSLFTRYPLIRLLVYSKEIFDVNRIQGALRVRNTEAAMEQLLRRSTLLLSVSFFLSAILNFIPRQRLCEDRAQCRRGSIQCRGRCHDRLVLRGHRPPQHAFHIWHPLPCHPRDSQTRGT